MKQNTAIFDRILRVALSAFLAWLYFTDRVTGAAGIALLAAAVIFTLTAVIGWCPIYALLRIRTKKKENV